MGRGPKTKKKNNKLTKQRKDDAFTSKTKNGKFKTKDANKHGADGGKSKTPAPVVSNPFTEIQNKRRSAILGQKIKGQKRNVMKARQDQAKERTTKLLDELRTRNRTTMFKDARFGENLDYDETMLRRFEKERRKQAKRSFALDENVELTHGGVALGEVPDEDLKGNELDGYHDLDAEAEREAMKMLQSENFSGDTEWKTREQIYDEIIAKSKKRKAELYREKETQERELNLFNADFQNIMQELQINSKKAVREAPQQSQEDKQYDIMAKNFAYERKVEASDRLKTKEELLDEKAERLAKLEKERQDRMKGIEKKKTTDKTNAEQEEDAEQDEDNDNEEEEDGEDDEDEDEDDEDAKDEEAEELDDEKEDGGEKGNIEADNNKAGSKVDDDEGEDGEEHGEEEEEESVDLDVDIDNTTVPRLATVSLPEKSYSSFFRPVPDLDPMVNLENEEQLPFSVAMPTSVAAYAGLEKYGLEHLAKVVLRARVTARQKASMMVRPLLDYLVETMKTKGFARLYALEPVLLEFLKDFSNDMFTYFTEKVDLMGVVDEPTMEYLALAKVAAHLFPTTDLWHPILTPVMMLLDKWAISMEIVPKTLPLALILFGLLYEYTSLAKRYSPGIFVLGQQLDCPQIKIVLTELVASFDVCPMGLGKVKSLPPLRLHYRAPAQVEMLDPVFHDPADGPIQKGDQKRSEELRLRRKVNEERRAAARNLRRDQQFLQVIKTKDQEKRARADEGERKRVRRIMDEEDKEIKKIMMEHSGMDTSLNPYSRTKKKKKENRRMAGNNTEESKKNSFANT